MLLRWAWRVLLISTLPLTAGATAALYWHHELGFSGSDVLALLPVNSPKSAISGMHLPQGFEASVVAAEPDVAQPIAMATDAHGWLWVAECRTYPNWNSGHEDQVVIFADRDADGSFESRTVFCGGLTNLSGIEIGLGGVWLLCSPQMLFIPDRDADGVPDGSPRVVLDGWDNHPHVAPHVANSLTWGPDGWLYGCLGGSSDSLVGAPGTPANRRVAVDAAVWRYHPQSGSFEIFASGTNNPWGLDFDETGELYVSNNILAHLWHIVPGGRYERLGPYLKSPASYEWMNACTDHNHWVDDRSQSNPEKARLGRGGHAHAGLLIYQGDNWPSQYRAGALLCNLHGRSINHDRLTVDHDEPLASHVGEVLTVDDPSYRGIDLECGPDGTLLVADWNARGSCLGSDTHAARPTGRIYRISFGPPPALSIDLDALSDEEVVALHAHTNVWYSRRARLVLQDRSYNNVLRPNTRDLLARLATDPAAATTVRLRTFWTWHAITPQDTAAPRKDLRLTLLDDPVPEVRAWAVRLSAESGQTEQVARWVEMAGSESDHRVRRELISALQRLTLEDRLPLAEALLPGMSNLQPRNWQRLFWYGLEPLIEGHPRSIIKLDESVHCSLINFAIARRIAELWSVDSGNLEISVAFDSLLSMLATAGADWRTATLQGLTEGLRGSHGPPPTAWLNVRDSLMAGDVPADAALIALIAAQFGELASRQNLLALARDKRRSADERLTALTGCLARPDERVQELVMDLSTDPEPALRRKALQSVAFFDCDLSQLFSNYAYLNLQDRQALVDAATSRASHAKQLLNQIEAGVVPVTDIDAGAARQLLTLNDGAVSAQLQQAWIKSGRVPGDLPAQRQRLSLLATADRLSGADSSHGEEVFTRHCAHCHWARADGGRVGPVLIGFHRGDLERLIVDIAEPSAIVGRQYRATMIQTIDGQLITGIAAEDTPVYVALSTPTGLVVVDKQNIESQRLLPASLMPNGLLDNLSDRDVQDLFAYLMTADD